MSLLAFFPTLGPSELLVVGVVAVLLFGSRLPAVARSAGKSLSEFRRGMNDLQDEFRTAMREADDAATTPVAGQLSRPADDPAPDTSADELSDSDGEEAVVDEGYPETAKPPYTAD